MSELEIKWSTLQSAMEITRDTSNIGIPTRSSIGEREAARARQEPVGDAPRGGKGVGLAAGNEEHDKAVHVGKRGDVVFVGSLKVAVAVTVVRTD